MERSGRQTRVRFRRIGLELKRLRQEAGMDLTEAALFLRRSTASLCRIESGSMIRERDLEYILDKYGVQDPLRSALLELSIKGAERGWWHRHARAETPELMDFISLEQDTRTIRNRQTDLIPGLLQTEDYARSLFSTSLCKEYAVDDIEAAVALRVKRQELLTDPKAPVLSVLINEGALHQ
ncbi:hypothetical protein GCM10009550_32790 [Actinocorallia libanotica]|uniref:DUF5753 domain-containing protein n=1 Tax=Actinocorallia libanotica TaxID=46162 RepID=A0ABP4BN61_9ACTN